MGGGACRRFPNRQGWGYRRFPNRRGWGVLPVSNRQGRGIPPGGVSLSPTLFVLEGALVVHARPQPRLVGETPTVQARPVLVALASGQRVEWGSGASRSPCGPQKVSGREGRGVPPTFQSAGVGRNRAGMGSSDPRPKQPHTTQDNVDALHALLHSAAIPAPYLLVGHSQGGFTVSLCAYQHPDEVAGLVLVDPPHPDNYRLYLEQLPPPAPDEPEYLERFRRFYAEGYKDPARNAEGIDVAASRAQVQRIRSLGNLPLVVLTASDLLRDARLNPDLARRFQHIHVQLGERWAHLSQRGSHQVIEASGHHMQRDVPEIVLSAIRQVLALSAG